MTPHRWAKEIKAWADGAEIEGKATGDWFHRSEPAWNDPGWQFRIKPERKVLRYRVALIAPTVDEDAATWAVYTSYECVEVERFPRFVRWLGDWQEVELC
jgi:hypothetical protein